MFTFGSKGKEASRENEKLKDIGRVILHVDLSTCLKKKNLPAILTCLLFLKQYFLQYLIIYFKRERVSEHGVECRGRERILRISSKFHPKCRAYGGALSHDLEIMT